MKFGKTGAVIGASERENGKPLIKVGAIPVLRRIILTLQSAGVFPIVVMTGENEEEIIHTLSSLGVIFLKESGESNCGLFESVREGLKYLSDKCERIFYTPVNSPMFTSNTLLKLLSSEGDIVIPEYEGRGGHPVLISSEVVEKIISYDGGGGLRGALMNTDAAGKRIPVPDRGIRMSVHNKEEMLSFLEEHNASLLSPVTRITIEKEGVILNSRLVLLLLLIGDFHSIRQASLHTGLSYQKAWNMINTLEKEAGYTVVTRERGGKDGGKTLLTEEGERLVYAFISYEEKIHSYSEHLFKEMFLESRIF